MDNLARAYEILCIVVLVMLGIGMLLALIRAIRGPRTADRLMGINMITTMTTIAICVLAFYLDQIYVLDVSLIYCMMSFLAVVVLTKIYITVHKEQLRKKLGKEEHDNDD